MIGIILLYFRFRFRYFLLWVFSALFVVLNFFGTVKAADVQSTVVPGTELSLQVPDTNLSTRILQVPGTDKQRRSKSVNALLPEWNQITLGSMPAINSSGSADVSGVNRSWIAGQTPDQFLKLGDISQSLHSELLPIGDIGQKIGLNMSQTALSAFPLVGEQTLSQLLKAVPLLGQLNIQSVSPILTLLKTKGLNVGNLPIARILNQFPQVGDFQLKEIDLRQFPLSSIPNLDATQLQHFEGWQETFVKDVPGLSSLPLAQFPTPVAELGGVVMRIDTVYGSAEAKRRNTISGSDVVGFNKGCNENCAYIELDDLENSGRNARGSLEGKQWISGKYQQVEGGWGCLKGVNGGKEPTGRLPFGSAFKVVVMEPDEKTDTVDTALYFRFKNFCGATPYFIGPVPFFTYRVNAPIFVGTLDSKAAVAVSVPKDLSPVAENELMKSKYLKPGVSNEQLKAEHLKPGIPSISSDLGLVQGVDINTLAESISSIESSGSYKAIGPYVCADKGKNCGRPLGRYQYMSYNGFAVKSISAKPGGKEFLDKLKNKTYRPTDAELFEYFPPADQEAAFKQDLTNKINITSQQIDPTTKKPFVGSRLIERAAQKHFGGDYSKVDGGGSDTFGRYSLKSYGQNVLKRYEAQKPQKR